MLKLFLLDEVLLNGFRYYSVDYTVEAVNVKEDYTCVGFFDGEYVNAFYEDF